MRGKDEPLLPPRVPGGKVLGRLQYAFRQRRLAPTHVATPAPEPPLSVAMMLARGFVAGARAVMDAVDLGLEDLDLDLDVDLEEGEEGEKEGGARLFRSVRGPTPTPAPTPPPAAGPMARSPYLTASSSRKRQVQALAKRGLFKSAAGVPAVPTWRSIGPSLIPNGQTYGAGKGSITAVSGRIAAVAVDPSNSAHVLAGAAAGGIWESFDSGATWEPRTDDQATLTTGAIAFVPGNPRTVFAGTGEGNFYSYMGTGLLRSDDGGTTWRRGAVSPFSGTGFYDLVIDPDNPKVMFAATTNCLAVSRDGGSTFTAQIPQKTWKVSIAPGGGARREVLVACGSGVLASSGGPWTPVPLPGAPASFGRVTVCHAPGDPGVAYVVAVDSALATPYMWQRTKAGGPFLPISPTPAGMKVNQGWYDWVAAVSPSNPMLLYVGAIDLYRGSPGSIGWVWQDIGSRPEGHSIHPDHHALVFDPNDPAVLYAGCDGGLFRSPDGGDTWNSLNPGLSITEFEYLALSPRDPEFVLGGTQDNGTLLRDKEQTWTQVYGGDGGDCGVNGSDPRVCYQSATGIGVNRSVQGGGVGTWHPVLPPQGTPALTYPPMAVLDTTVAQAGQTVYVSQDQGASWAAIPLPPGQNGSALEAVTPTLIWVGTDQGSLYLLQRTGPTWGTGATLVALPTPGPGYVSDVFVNPARPREVWVSYSDLGEAGGVFYSADGGITWQNRAGTGTDRLPPIPVNAVVVDPKNPQRVFAALDAQVYESLNQGGTWKIYGEGLPNAIVGDLVLHARSRLLRAGTRSRGVWEIEI